MEHSDCTQALHAVRQHCSANDVECLRAHGVGATNCDHPLTSCMAAGTSEPVRVCLTHPTEQSQTVYGLGMQGNPTKVIN